MDLTLRAEYRCGHGALCDALNCGQLLDAVRLGPDDDVAKVTADQVRRVVTDLIDGGQWQSGDPDVLVVFDAVYDAPRMAYLLDGLLVEVLGRMRSERVMR